MRYLLILWVVPMVLFWGWYGFSAYDINFGTIFLSRDLHDLVFEIYGRTLGVGPEAIPPLIASATVIDSAIIGAIVAFRWRSRWWPGVSMRLVAAQREIRRRYFSLQSVEDGLQGDAFVPHAHVAVTRPTDAPYGPAHPAE